MEIRGLTSKQLQSRESLADPNKETHSRPDRAQCGAGLRKELGSLGNLNYDIDVTNRAAFRLSPEVWLEINKITQLWALGSPQSKASFPLATPLF